MKGIPEILFSRILMFMWPFGALQAAASLQQLGEVGDAMRTSAQMPGLWVPMVPRGPELLRGH